MAVYHERGFDAHFVEPLNDRYTCSICHLAAREPMLTKCGHQFCQGCLRPLIRDGNVTCSMCREELKKSEMFLNNMTKREILSLKIFCDKCWEGCSWQGELRQRDEHNQECGYLVVACSNDCGEMIIRMDMDYHKQNECNRRIVGCCYCDAQLEYGQLTVHYEMCDSYPVDCPNECGIQVARKDVEVHTSREGVCPTSPLQCDFVSAGCQFIGNREQLQDHLNKNIVYHLSLAMQTVSNVQCVQERLASAEKKQAETDNELAAVKKTLQHTESELVVVKKTLQHTESELVVVKKTLRKTESDLVAVKKTLQMTDNESVDVNRTLQQTESSVLAAGYKTFSKFLDGECLTRDQSQSVGYVKALVDKRIQISCEMGETFVHLWKIESHQLAHLKWSKSRPYTILSNKFNTGNQGLHLQLELSCQRTSSPCGSSYTFEAKVNCCGQQHNKKLHKSKYLMSILLHNNHYYRSRVQKEIDFSLPTTRGQFHDLEKDFLFVVCPKFEQRSYRMEDGLLVVFELQSKL
ncbi:TNF receptor-associated factor 3-like [Corticium candelabrum]|uniref:TNF receptor-associated factor 3-like n=1 Tax=Corticium candelabrum TaxID=121492 RepID=UPI002E266499|nr:TNF receptor-associated factor 3-like [Corticium candelabrum]